MNGRQQRRPYLQDRPDKDKNIILDLRRTRGLGMKRLRNELIRQHDLDLMIAGPEGGPSSDMQRYEG